jgi:hypothetical protein
MKQLQKNNFTIISQPINNQLLKTYFINIFNHDSFISDNLGLEHYNVINDLYKYIITNYIKDSIYNVTHETFLNKINSLNINQIKISLNQFNLTPKNIYGLKINNIDHYFNYTYTDIINIKHDFIQFQCHNSKFSEIVNNQLFQSTPIFELTIIDSITIKLRDIGISIYTYYNIINNQLIFKSLED